MAVNVEKIADVPESEVIEPLSSRILEHAYDFADKLRDGVRDVFQQCYPGQPYLLKRVEDLLRPFFSRNIWPQPPKHH